MIAVFPSVVGVVSSVCSVMCDIFYSVQHL